jgi:hypothetical protein
LPLLQLPDAPLLDEQVLTAAAARAFIANTVPASIAIRIALRRSFMCRRSSISI